MSKVCLEGGRRTEAGVGKRVSTFLSNLRFVYSLATPSLSSIDIDNPKQNSVRFWKSSCTLMRLRMAGLIFNAEYDKSVYIWGRGRGGGVRCLPFSPDKKIKERTLSEGSLGIVRINVIRVEI